MYPTSMELEARQERYKDLWRASERARLIREAGLQPDGLWTTVRKFVCRAGAIRLVWRRINRAHGVVAGACAAQRCC